MNKWNNKAINKMEDQQINKKKEPYVFCCVDRLDWIQETRDSPESESILSPYCYSFIFYPFEYAYPELDQGLDRAYTILITKITIILLSLFSTRTVLARRLLLKESQSSLPSSISWTDWLNAFPRNIRFGWVLHLPVLFITRGNYWFERYCSLI